MIKNFGGLNVGVEVGGYAVKISFLDKMVFKTISSEEMMETAKAVVAEIGRNFDETEIIIALTLGTVRENRKNANILSDMRAEARYMKAIGFEELGPMIDSSEKDMNGLVFTQYIAY